jgi:dephospho-CoA kinase
MIIGITGTLGAGKGTIVEYLIRQKGFIHFSVREFLLSEIKKRQMPQNRDSMVIVANELRAKHSPSYIIDELYNESQKINKNSVIESIRTPGEVYSLRGKDLFFLFGVDADPAIRFKRIKLRKSETDQIDFQTFIKNEEREMTSTDPNKQNLKKCLELADFLFTNNGSMNDLYKEIEHVLIQIDGNPD